jgi:hypothetical protein
VRNTPISVPSNSQNAWSIRVRPKWASAGCPLHADREHGAFGKPLDGAARHVDALDVTQVAQLPEGRLESGIGRQALIVRPALGVRQYAPCPAAHEVQPWIQFVARRHRFRPRVEYRRLAGATPRSIETLYAMPRSASSRGGTPAADAGRAPCAGAAAPRTPGGDAVRVHGATGTFRRVQRLERPAPSAARNPSGSSGLSSRL